MTMPYTFIVRFDIAPLWVADGASINDAQALQMLSVALPHACPETELAASVLVAPRAERICKEQGWDAWGQSTLLQAEMRKLVDASPNAYGEDGTVLALLRLADKTYGMPESQIALQTVIKMLTGEFPISNIEWQEVEE